MLKFLTPYSPESKWVSGSMKLKHSCCIQVTEFPLHWGWYWALIFMLHWIHTESIDLSPQKIIRTQRFKFSMLIWQGVFDLWYASRENVISDLIQTYWLYKSTSNLSTAKQFCRFASYTHSSSWNFLHWSSLDSRLVDIYCLRCTDEE